VSSPRPASLVDGRRRRSARSRQAIAEALLDLVGKGVLEPTAQQVAERAGVDIRTVFRHFSDMETLFAEMEEHLRAGLGHLAEETPVGTLEARARDLVRRRAEVFERLAPYKRAGDLQRRRSGFLQRKHRELVGKLRDDLLRWLPELAADGDLLEALDLVTSFEAWDRLREDQRLVPRRARAAMERSVLALTRSLCRGRDHES
jgi:AcrR family transcriptional regulator